MQSCCSASHNVSPILSSRVVYSINNKCKRMAEINTKRSNID
ncbi:Uncharacterised protein [Vibrio cholerae]|nr:Uncharacterised protein [Vibrio cholerae]